jgi:hypothetical protein
MKGLGAQIGRPLYNAVMKTTVYVSSLGTYPPEGT